MDIREFSNKFVESTKNMSAEERASLMKIFEGISKEITKEDKENPVTCTTSFARDGGVPNGITERLKRLKENYLKWTPTITTHRARAITKIAKENPGMPKSIFRGKSFRYCCETAPLVIQDNELIVGAPCGAPRAGAASPDIAW